MSLEYVLIVADDFRFDASAEHLLSAASDLGSSLLPFVVLNQSNMPVNSCVNMHLFWPYWNLYDSAIFFIVV